MATRVEVVTAWAGETALVTASWATARGAEKMRISDLWAFARPNVTVDFFGWGDGMDYGWGNGDGGISDWFEGYQMDDKDTDYDGDGYGDGVLGNGEGNSAGI